ncbi:MAG TPA: LysR family transcriptional regulator [Pseudonocardia sp.]|nr:LysR family transcriptional regulator [Pseudonocardia sp.]
MPGDILIRQLEYLAALAREEHFGRAAASCHASQPALSTALRKLETALGVTIVQRGSRFSGFTPEGHRVVGWAHRILAERDALHQDLDRMRHGMVATVRIGAIPTAVPATSLLTAPFCARNPLARVRIEVLSSREIVRRLSDFDLDVGLTYLDGSAPSARTALELYQEQYLLLTTADSELARRETVDWAAAATLPLCTLGPNMQNRRILDAAMAAAGARLDPVVEADNVAALYAHVATHRWSSIIAHTWLHAFGVPPGMRAIPLADPGPRPAVGIVIADHQPESIVASALIDAVRETDVSAVLDRSVAAAMARASAEPTAEPTAAPTAAPTATQ